MDRRSPVDRRILDLGPNYPGKERLNPTTEETISVMAERQND
jgi:hypothetical protein